MGKVSRVDQMPLVYDDDVSLRSFNLSGIHDSPDFSVKITDDDIAEMYGTTGASAGGKGDGYHDPGKNGHLLKSRAIGRCDDPFCSTCPSSYELPAILTRPKDDHVRTAESVLYKKVAQLCKSLMPGILNPHSKVVQRWNKIFCISSLIALFIDPLYFFLLSIDEARYCLIFNAPTAVVVTVIRSITDVMHVLHIVLQFRLAYVAPASKIRRPGELEDDPSKIARHYLKGWFSLDLFTSLPLPQVLMWTVVKQALGKQEGGANLAKNLLRMVVVMQDIPRTLRFIPLMIGQSPSGFVFETAWSNFVINLLMYLLAGHIVGSSWYFFGLQRINDCLHDACRDESQGLFNPVDNVTVFCKKEFLDCGAGGVDYYENDPTYQYWLRHTSVASACLSATSSFPYGIYEICVQVVLETRFINTYIYSLFWGFLQISTLAGNQVPSMYAWEVVFTMSIVGLGLLLLALLIGNMQNFLQSLGRRKMDMQLMRYDTEAWMKQRRLPVSLRRRVRHAGRFKWVATGGVEERELLSDLPEDLQKDIQRYLCLDLVKKVRLFELLEDHVLDAICERLYQKLYIDGSEVFRAKRPVERMLFIVRGKLESHGEDGSVVQLKEGDFCGEELLSWYVDMAGISTLKKAGRKESNGRHPLSSRTVRCVTSVEAFSLDSAQLQYITNYYKAALRSPRVQGVIRYLSLYWRSLAATVIQSAWRAHQAKRPRPAAVPHNLKERRLTSFATMNSRRR